MNWRLKTGLIVGAVVLGLIVAQPFAPGIVRGWQGYGGMMGPGMMGGYGSMFLMPILWIGVIGLIVWGVTATVRRPGESDTTIRTGLSPGNTQEALCPGRN